MTSSLRAMRGHAFLSVLLGLTLGWISFLWSPKAAAYPWMIRHEYSGCATCHTDPSGAGVLTPYGRAQSELLLSTQFKKTSEEDEPGPFKEFLFGAFKSPDWLQLQGWVRNGYIWNDVDGNLVDHRKLQMRADLGAHVALDAFRAAATIGYNIQDSAAYSEQAWVTGPSTAGNIVAREYWAGAALKDDTILVRGGRINLPFGLRNIEHTSWIRSETRTDINQGQQHGAALAYSSDKLRAELMAIAGNFQIHPDAYRERGYSLYAEAVLGPRYTLGLSSLVAQHRPIQERGPRIRGRPTDSSHASPPFARWRYWAKSMR